MTDIGLSCLYVRELIRKDDKTNYEILNLAKN